MWDSDQVLAMVGSIGILITALGAVIVNIIVALRTGKKVDENVKAIESVSHQVQEVHTLTNSNLSAVKAELKQAVTQLDEMKTFVRDLKNERDKLAILTASNKIGPVASHHIPSANDVREVLESIDKNTDNIDKNTKVLQTSIDKNTAETSKNTKEVKEKK